MSEMEIRYVPFIANQISTPIEFISNFEEYFNDIVYSIVGNHIVDYDNSFFSYN